MFICQQCKKEFSTKRSLISHSNWHNQLYRNNCSKGLFGNREFHHEKQKCKKAKKVSEYNLKPKNCFACDQILDYEKRHNKFCSSSCSAKFNRTGRKHSLETKKKISDKIKHQPVRKGYKIKTRVFFRNCKCCKILFCTPKANRLSCSEKCHAMLMGGPRFKRIVFNGTSFDSKWEILVAKDLDKNKIRWIRPQGLTYVNENKKTKKYVPDFYLPDYDVYLDPKNQYVRKIQKEKLVEIEKFLEIKLILLDKHQLSWSEIQKLL